jgi:hypothetical protein
MILKSFVRSLFVRLFLRFSCVVVLSFACLCVCLFVSFNVCFLVRLDSFGHRSDDRKLVRRTVRSD